MQLLSGKLGKEMLSLFFKNLHKSALEIAGLSTNQEGIFPVFPYFPAQLGQGSAEYLSNQNREWGLDPYKSFYARKLSGACFGLGSWDCFS